MSRGACWGTLVGLALLAWAASASAAPVTFSPCPGKRDVGCATLTVPLDRSGSAPGQIDLHVERVRARGHATGVLLALVGGPGQAGGAFTQGLASSLRPALARNDLVVMDQRGTGRSGLLRCPALEKTIDVRLMQIVAPGCAEIIGPQRAFYTTRDAAEDIEALRQALGVERISIYGVSYGTKLALAYALAHPANVDRLVLDSVVVPDKTDAFDLSTFAAVPRVLREICVEGRCEGITRDLLADVAALVRRLERAPIHGAVVRSRDGSRKNIRLNRNDLFDILVAGDLNPTLRLDFPAAVRSALEGDSGPLLRLKVRADNTEKPGDSPKEFSSALFAATTCEESAVPWPRGASLPDRIAQSRAAVQAIPASAFAPFDRQTAYDESAAELCLEWPTAPPDPVLGAGPLPDVPVLELTGTADLRTPFEDAQGIGLRFPHARVVKVASGHSVLTSDFSGCATRALGAFFAGRRPSSCGLGPGRLHPTGLPPRSLDEVRPTRGLATRVGQVVAATELTLHDAERAELATIFTAPSVSQLREGGLRGGYFRTIRRGIALHHLQYVPHVRVSGLLPSTGRRLAIVRVRAPGASGVLRVDQDGTVTGRLGQVRVHARFRTGPPVPLFRLLI